MSMVKRSGILRWENDVKNVVGQAAFVIPCEVEESVAISVVENLAPGGTHRNI
jgi:hypothetical protein